MNSTTRILNTEIFSDSDCTTTEDMNEDQHYIEQCVREETQLWLDNHATKLFQLEASKYLAKQNRKPKFQAGRPSK